MATNPHVDDDYDQTIPLLYHHTIPTREGAGAGATTAVITAPAPKPLSPIQSKAITFFSTVRILRGILFITLPSIALSSFNIPTTGITFLLGAFVGSRDLLLGGLLATTVPFKCREVHRALLATLLSDTGDTLILIFSAACAWHVRAPVVEIVASAVMAVLQHLTLFSMSLDDDEDGNGAGRAANNQRGSMGYQKMLQAHEDQKNRLDNWLVEMRRAEESRLMNGSPRPSSTVQV